MFDVSYDKLIKGARGTGSIIDINLTEKDEFTPGDAEACAVCFLNFAGEVRIVACDLL